MVYRDHSGKYAYDGNWDRLCVCGHTLGAHIAGGHECGQIPDYPETKGCECKKFKPKKDKS